VFDEVGFQRLLVIVQFAAGALPTQAAEACQAAGRELVEVALHGAWGDSGEVGNLGVGQSLALQPEDLHLALDAGMRVMVTLVAKLRHDCRAEGEHAHGGQPATCDEGSNHAVGIQSSCGNSASLSRAEYSKR
jgi:hypothetical protein